LEEAEKIRLQELAEKEVLEAEKRKIY